jgi:hypothetical protein
MAIDVVSFGCRLNAYESEVMRKAASEAGLGELAGDPQGAARSSRRPHHRHRLRRADRSGCLRRHGRGRPRARQ